MVRSYSEDGRHQALSYASLWKRSGSVAAALSAAGAVPSSFVVILAEGILDFLPSYWACLRGGYIPVALMSAAKDAVYRDRTSFDGELELENPV